MVFMNSWEDTGFIVSVRSHGNASAVISVLTEHHGRHAGYVKAALASKNKSLYDLGNEVEVDWASRLEGSLGSFKVQMKHPYPARYLDEPLKLLAIQSMCAMVDMALAEREQHPAVYQGIRVFYDNLDTDVWLETYLYFEMALLKEMGFGLDLRVCASTGEGDGHDSQKLIYVSPKSGRAVSQSAGEPYKDKLLPMPRFMIGKVGETDVETRQDVMNGFDMLGYFFEHRVFTQTYQQMPDARVRFVNKYIRDFGG